MKSLRLAALPLLISAACAAHAQTADIAVNDGMTGSCYGVSGSTPCSYFTAPTIDTFVSDGAGNFSEITTTTAATSLLTQDGSGTWSGLNVTSGGTALESSAASGSAAAATQTGISSITGLDGGQFIATGKNASGQDSSISLEGTMGFLRTRDTSSGALSFYETDLMGTTMGYAENGTPIATISSNVDGHQILGNTALTGTLSVTGASTLNGIDNQNAGITQAGLISGVANGAVTATSTEAVNGSQLFATQTTANTALANAATAQSTADTAITDAAAAQATADTAIVNAATAQTTADTALTHAASAQATADTAVTEAATAKATAVDAHALAETAQTNASTAMVSSANAWNMANTANANALSAYNVASGLSGRISSLEGRVDELRADLADVDRVAGRGIAIATALASMPDLEPGKRAGLGIGLGSYDGHNAVSAAFVIRATENAKFRVNGGTAGDGKFAFGAGGMFSW